jgi:hypothetical protein
MKRVLRGLVLDLLNAGLMLQTGRPDDRLIILLGVRSWPNWDGQVIWLKTSAPIVALRKRKSKRNTDTRKCLRDCGQRRHRPLSDAAEPGQ